MFKVNNIDTRTTLIGILLVSVLLIFNIFHILFWSFYCSIVNFEHVIARWVVLEKLVPLS